MSLIARKLQVKPGQYWLLYNAPANYLSLLEPLPEGAAASFHTGGDFDGVQLFVKNRQELADSLEVIMPLLKPQTVFWIIYPKKNSGIETDLEMMKSWEALDKYGYGAVTAAAIDQHWTALRFKPKALTKTSETCNDEIKQNDYRQWIDVDKRTITLPDDIKLVLQKSTKALAAYESLSYSNRKEYLVWILSAKQEKTRIERLVKLVEKLKAGKKNPAEK